MSACEQGRSVDISFDVQWMQHNTGMVQGSEVVNEHTLGESAYH